MKKEINVNVIVLIAITIFQWALLWGAWTADTVVFSDKTEEFEKRVEMLDRKCDSLGIANSVLSQVRSDTVIVNVPSPVVKIIKQEIYHDVIPTSD